MILTPKTKLLELTKEYPFLIEFLAGYHPRFAALANPVMRNTLGRSATLGKIAAMGGMPLNELIEAVKSRVAAESGHELGVDLGQGPLTREARRDVLKGLITEMHDGGDFEAVKQRFTELIEDVGPSEIAEMEQELIDAGMPESEIHRLCDVHAELFKDSLDTQELPSMPPGHPVHTFVAENEALERLAAELETMLKSLGDPPKEAKLEGQRDEMKTKLEEFWQVDYHYLRKENQLFPALEAHGASGPPQVMWAVHDEVRSFIKDARVALEDGNAPKFVESTQAAITKFRDMVFKEQHILLPMALEMLSDEEWLQVYHGEPAIGFAHVERGKEWPGPEQLAGSPGRVPTILGKPQEHTADSYATVLLNFDTGVLSPEQANLLFNHLPVEISFTDEHHIVRYYSEGTERIFPRSPGVIGRHVTKCHPPKSLHMVQSILKAFEAGERDVAEFWIDYKGRKVHIRYFALRDHYRCFRGTMEVVQDVTDIQALEGQRKLLEWT